jgi:hypothetical protein
MVLRGFAMKKLKIIIQLVIIVVLCLIIVNKVKQDSIEEKVMLRQGIHKFLQSEKNRTDAYKAAVKLNQGNSENTCVYFISEVLRRNNFEIAKEIANTTQIISILKEEGWQKDSDYKNLKPGDICFTTDAKGNKNGVPTHTYVFMGWVKEGNYDYAYICDNQAKDYDNKVYHVRNLKVVDKANGFTKDSFSFFMKAA